MFPHLLFAAVLVVEHPLAVESQRWLAIDASLQAQRAVRQRHLSAPCQGQRAAAPQQGCAVLRPVGFPLIQVREQHPGYLPIRVGGIRCLSNSCINGGLRQAPRTNFGVRRCKRGICGS